MIKKYPTIPKNPVTLFINGWLTDNTLNNFMRRYLPAWDYKITSGYRDAEDQLRLKKKGLKPATYSAHLYNLARDFVLVNKETGKTATDEQMKKLFTEYFKPHWEGYAYFSRKQPGTKTGWIHLNIERKMSDVTSLIGLAAMGLGVGMSIKTIFKNINKMKK